MRLIDACITQLKAQGPCNASKEEEKKTCDAAASLTGVAGFLLSLPPPCERMRPYSERKAPPDESCRIACCTCLSHLIRNPN